jgi:hypothetical protein
LEEDEIASKKDESRKRPVPREDQDEAFRKKVEEEVKRRVKEILETQMTVNANTTTQEKELESNSEEGENNSKVPSPALQEKPFQDQ